MKNQKHTYQNQIEVQLNAWSARIAELKEMAEEIDDAAKSEQIETLQQKERSARNYLQRLQKSDDNDWQDVKLSLDNAIADLRKSVQAVFVELNR